MDVIMPMPIFLLLAYNEVWHRGLYSIVLMSIELTAFMREENLRQIGSASEIDCMLKHIFSFGILRIFDHLKYGF